MALFSLDYALKPPSGSKPISTTTSYQIPLGTAKPYTTTANAPATALPQQQPMFTNNYSTTAPVGSAPIQTQQQPQGQQGQFTNNWQVNQNLVQQPIPTAQPQAAPPLQQNYYPNPSLSAGSIFGERPDPYSTSQAQQFRGALSGPGIAENWYAQNAAKFAAPTQLSQYWNQVQGRMMGQRFQPTTASDAYARLSAEMGGGQGQQNSLSVSRQLRENTAGDRYMDQGAQMLQGPNAMQAYADMTAPFFSPGNNTASQGFYNTQGQALTRRGEGENYAHNVGISALANNRALVDPSQSSRFFSDSRSQFTSPGQGEQAALSRLLGTNWGGVDLSRQGLEYAQGQAATPTESATTLQGLRPELSGPSYSEQLYQQGRPGFDAYYDLQRKRQTEDLQNQMAAMGLFGSGETIEGMARIREGIGAEQAGREADYMMSLAGQADQGRLGRAGLLGDLSSSTDAANLGRLNTMLGAYGQASDEALAGQGLALDATGRMLDVDRQALDRLMGGMSAAGTADQSSLAQIGMQADLFNRQAELGLAADQLGLQRTQLGGQLASQYDQAELAKALGGAQVANMGTQSRIAQGSALANAGAQSSQAELARLLGSSSTGLQADQEQRARLEALMSGANQLDSLRLQGGAQDLAYLTAGGQMAGAADAGESGRLNDAWQAAQDAQRIYQERERYSFLDPLALGQSMAKPYGDMATASTTEQGQLKTAAANLLMQRYGMTAAQAEAQAQAWAVAGQNPLQMAQNYGMPGRG